MNSKHMNYNQIINKVLSQMEKKNISIYFKKFLIKLKQQQHELKTAFNNDEEFISYMTDLVHMYHPHAFFMQTMTTPQTNSLSSSKNFNKPTEFTIGTDNIGIIKLFDFYINYGVSENIQKKEQTIYENNIISFLDKNSNMRGLILDFRHHQGGDMHPLIFALSRFLNNSSLFAWSNIKVKKTDKKWVNLIDGVLKFDQYYISNSTNNNHIPIAVIIGEKTGSSGEFVASSFIDRDNVKLFGEKSGGFLSANATYFYDDKYIFLMPELLQTSRNLEFKEFIEPNVVTTQPITEAKIFIKNTLIGYM